MTNSAKPKFTDYYALMERAAYIEANGETPEETYLQLGEEEKRKVDAGVLLKMEEIKRAAVEEGQRKAIKEAQLKAVKKSQRIVSAVLRQEVLNLHNNHHLLPEQIIFALDLDMPTVQRILRGK